MRIFLSYASQDREPAESIYLALRDQGHRVFFDRAALLAGEEYHNRIRAEIEKTHLFIFLFSPNAIDAGSYTLTELDIAEKAKRKLLPVALGKLDAAQLPGCLEAVTCLQSEGNLAAAVAAEVRRIARARWCRRIKIAAIAAAIVMIVAIVVFYEMSRPHKNEITGRDGAPALLVPGGSFVIGNDEDTPRRTVFVDGFYLDQFEITVARYAAFLKATGNVGAPEEWHTLAIERDGALPVVGVDWSDADAYYRWAGRRLPTDAEWERAARGSDERKYPWGNDAPTDARARFLKDYQNPVYKDGVAPVGSHPQGISPFGIHDLAGNVWEWVADWFGESFPPGESRNPQGPKSGTAKVMRGGGWYDPPEQLTTTRRMQASPEHRDESVGFRCAKDAR